MYRERINSRRPYKEKPTEVSWQYDHLREYVASVVGKVEVDRMPKNLCKQSFAKPLNFNFNLECCSVELSPKAQWQWIDIRRSKVVDVGDWQRQVDRLYRAS